MNKLQERLAEEGYLVLDGAMGTMLMADDLEQGAAPELWNIRRPERVAAVHTAYIEAGSDVVLTNSFGGTRLRLMLHGLQEETVALNRAAGAVARSAADKAPHPVLVAGSIGPSGELLVPMGSLSFEKASEAFAEQASGLAEGGVDLFWIETMSDLDEVRAAVEGIRSVSDLPIAATMSFDTRGRTMMGVTAQDAALALKEMGAAAIGANCGNNLPDTEAAAAAMHEVVPDLPVIAKANAGIPRWVGAELAYDGTPPVMAGYARRAYKAGARLIGACCGSTPEHIAAMVAALEDPEAPAAPAPSRARSSTNGANAQKESGSRSRRRRRRS